MREGWTYKKLGDIATLINGDRGKNYPSTDDFINVGVPFINAGHIQNGVVDFSEMNYISEQKFDSLRSGKVNKGDILFCLRGSLGKSALVSIDYGAIASSLVIIRPHSDNSHFIQYYLQSNKVKELIQKNNNGSSQPNLSATSVANFSIPIPTLFEQQRIVSELDLLSGIIKKKKAQLKEYDQLAQSIFYDMFGDPVENEKGWEVKKLGEVGLIVTGNTPSTRDNRNYDSNDICFIKPSDIKKEGISMLSESEFYVSAFAYNNARKLPKGSVLVTCIGIVGKVGILETDATCNQQINAIIPNNQVDSYYIAFSILAKRRIIESIAHAPVVPIINKGTFSKLSIPLPPLSLQQSFAEKIESIEQQKALIQQSITETETLFNSRMDYYFN